MPSRTIVLDFLGERHTISRALTDTPEAPGCRDAALVTSFLLALAIVFFAIGLTLVNREACSGLCETLGLTLLYAGGPASALFGVFTDSVVVAWPLDITLWVLTGFVLARRHSRTGTGLWGSALFTVVGGLAYGLVLSQLVELTV